MFGWKLGKGAAFVALQHAGTAWPPRWRLSRARLLVAGLERNWALSAVLILLWIIISAAVGSMG